jgi:hypothetical protein
VPSVERGQVELHIGVKLRGECADCGTFTKVMVCHDGWLRCGSCLNDRHGLTRAPDLPG